ncbi:hypothetical protein J6524_34515 [Bradyrhizobium sp. WSM 1738]|uniref:hypothetical protein n=1 Tax=Bradyrhizobium hereditatis TaxID=2821405 RepID=UPI001CE3410B|nr:hypothetical protein [Bradyrhizobium hereditatis]MCA6119950.1 hypothetical protein [Bradyrhizobium hereditatis]
MNMPMSPHSRYAILEILEPAFFSHLRAWLFIEAVGMQTRLARSFLVATSFLFEQNAAAAANLDMRQARLNAFG